MPDPALPNTVCTLRREIPIRLLHALLFMSYMSMRVQSSLPPDLVNCALPGNFNDDDLTQCGGIIIPQPLDVVTDSSFEVRTFSCSLKSYLTMRLDGRLLNINSHYFNVDTTN